jgi:hypothetical protein
VPRVANRDGNDMSHPPGRIVTGLRSMMLSLYSLESFLFALQKPRSTWSIFPQVATLFDCRRCPRSLLSCTMSRTRRELECTSTSFMLLCVLSLKLVAAPPVRAYSSQRTRPVDPRPSLAARPWLCQQQQQHSRHDASYLQKKKQRKDNLLTRIRAHSAVSIISWRSCHIGGTASLSFRANSACVWFV